MKKEKVHPDILMSLCEKFLFTHVRKDERALCARVECWNGQEWRLDGVQILFHPLINPNVFSSMAICLSGREVIVSPYFGQDIKLEFSLKILSGSLEIRLITDNPRVFDDIVPIFEKIQVFGYVQVYGAKKVTV